MSWRNRVRRRHAAIRRHALQVQLSVHAKLPEFGGLLKQSDLIPPPESNSTALRVLYRNQSVGAFLRIAFQAGPVSQARKAAIGVENFFLTDAKFFAKGMVRITHAAIALARTGAISLAEAWRVRAD